MKIIHIPCLEDNYAYLIMDEATKEAAVVDPVDPEMVLRVAMENRVELKLVLTTNHHWDHDGGNNKMTKLVPGIKVYGGSIDNVQGCTDKVNDGDKISLGANVSISCLHTVGVTRGHICYYVIGKEGDDPAVFTGDTLSVAGCGEFNTGSAKDMHLSLCKLVCLPKATRVYCGHEYTVKNLQFALFVEPANSTRISEKLSWAEQQRQSNSPTIPSTIEQELYTNPFMRVDLREVQEALGCKTEIDALDEINTRRLYWPPNDPLHSPTRPARSCLMSLITPFLT